MARITLAQAASWCGGTVDPKYAEVTFYGASNDSRAIKGGQLFVALQGARDGHDFIPMALENGAAAVLCNHCDGEYPAIVVEDTRIALGRIAAAERQRIGMKVVGVTGSVGKSTTKEMICAVLASQFKVSKTPANHNNDIGMPMAVLSIPENTEVAVLEMGMNHFGEISYLTNIARPDLAVIINIGTMHIEHLGSREGILQAKLEILEGLAAEGTILLNGDDDLLWSVRERKEIPASYFGVANEACAVCGSEVTMEEGSLSFKVNDKFTVTLPLEGEHYILDALAAVSVGLKMGICPEKIVTALSNFRNMEGRQEIFEKGGYTIIKDCYNAGPESMSAALNVLGKRKGRRVAVLGDMLELGMRAPAEHYRIGRIAAEQADIVLAYGPQSIRVVSGAVTGGMSKTKVRSFEDRQALVSTLKAMAKPGDTILFKGSHGMHMELALEGFFSEEA